MQALEYGEKFYKQERHDSELPIAALTRQLVSIHSTKKKNYKLQDFCLFVDKEQKIDVAPQVANTYFTLAAQRKLPPWCFGLGIDDENLRPLTDKESGYTVPRAWINEEYQVFFISPFFSNGKLIIPLAFFGRARGRGSVIKMSDIDNADREYRVYLDRELQLMRGWCDKEVFELAREVTSE